MSNPDAMDNKVDDVPFFWTEESQELSVPVKTKRKVRPKKMEFTGWGSKPLIEFLKSIGKDTSKQISQYEVAAIINEYFKTNNLVHPQKKKKILCDERLHSLFGRKSVVRIKIYDLLETHFAENQDESEDEFLLSSEEIDDNTMIVAKQHKASSSDRKNFHQRKNVSETPKSCYAAMISENIKLVYLKRSLVQDLLKVPETFESKVVGSFVRVKSDPDDYFQKNSHQLLQVTGVSKASGTDSIFSEILHVSNMMKEIRICMLSDDNFSEEECEDLRQRVKSGSLNRPTVVDFQQKAQMLHEDITKNWLVRELSLLQNLIDRANEKGWRKELFEYLERKQQLQTPSEQTRLLLEVPKVIADEIEQEATTPQEGSNGSPRSILRAASEVSTYDLEVNQTFQKVITDAAGSADVVILPKVDPGNLSRDFISGNASNKEPKEDQPGQFVEQQKTQHLNLEEEESKASQGRVVEKVVATQVIELSDDDKESEDHGGSGRRDQILGYHPGSPIWHYADPQGDIQGPFSLESLKRWSDANYFPPNFKVWKTGQSPVEAVLLSDVLLQMFSNSLE